MRMILCDIEGDVLTPDQREKLAAFFADATEENRRKAIFWVDRGLRLWKAYQADRPNRKSAARQIAKMKTHLDGLFNELTGLNPDTIEAINRAGQRRAENGYFDGWSLTSELPLASNGLLSKVAVLRQLCGMALEDLPEQGKRARPKGTDAEPEKALAGYLVEAFARAFGRLPKAKSGNTDSELSPIYEIIGAWYSHHHFKEAKQAIENNRDFY